jgi:hypothetical protein
MWRWSIWELKDPLIDALNHAFEFASLSNFEKGKIIDKTFKSIVKDLMDQFGMRPGVDYVDNLNDNEPGTDFVALSEEADDLLRGIMEGRIVAISAHSRVSKLGNEFKVKAHFRDLRKAS